MRRILAISTVIVLLLAVLASVAWAAPGGGKGKPTTTMTTSLDVCDFDTTGVLAGWHGQKFGYRCLFLEDTPADYAFEIEFVDADLIMHPYLAVVDTSPGGGICFREYVHGRVSPDDPPITFELSLPGDCDPVDEFRLTVQGTAKGGATRLRMLASDN